MRHISLARAAVVPPCRGQASGYACSRGACGTLSTGLGGAVVVYRGKRACLLSNPRAGPLSIHAASQGLRADQVHSVVFQFFKRSGLCWPWRPVLLSAGRRVELGPVPTLLLYRWLYVRWSCKGCCLGLGAGRLMVDALMIRCWSGCSRRR